MSSLGGGLRSVDWATAKLSVFEKNFYAEDKSVSARSDKEIEDFRRRKEIKASTLFLHTARRVNPHVIPGSRPQCTTTCDFLRGGWLPGIPYDNHSCTRFH